MLVTPRTTSSSSKTRAARPDTLSRHAIGDPLSAAIQRKGVIQRVIRDDIIGRGYTGGEADDLRVIMGGSWGNADGVSRTCSPAYYRRVVQEQADNGIRRKIFENLDEHHYGVLKVFVQIHGGNLLALIRKDINNRLVERMIGSPVPAARAVVLGLSGVAELTNLAGLGYVFERFPDFVEVVRAESVAAPAALQEVINYLAARTGPELTYLQTNTPDFATLRVLQAETIVRADMERLHDLAEDAPPGNDTYEDLGNKGYRYRIGHFARKHTLRGMRLNDALDSAKTLWPMATTVDQLRGVCTDFDANNVIAYHEGRSYYYTPTVVPNSRIFARKESLSMHFAQMYPTEGETIGAATLARLSAAKIAKPAWTAWP